ncbi:MAG TPA: lycopene cyclase domain-containing protein [Ktedonobacterales bacterium]|jgi:lycopene cyclase domain-containing protein|nr:lycopene cyclase domain-containing protein [Ktedonobacterales bacterium]
MTYADFLLIFLIAPLIALGVTMRRRLLDRRYLALAGGLTLVALLYMAPWDHTAAAWGLWTWAPGRTWGARWWDVPPEEYLFCILEALLASTLIYVALRWRGRITTDASATNPRRQPRTLRTDISATFIMAALLAPTAGTRWAYLPFLLVWALPVIGIQWALGGRYLWRERRVWPWVALGLCAYFTLADAIAISAGVWSFDARALTGIALGPVPLEEILFYLLTALMVTQGFVTLWYGYTDRHALARRAHQRVTRARGWRRAGASRAPTRAERAPQGSRDGR